MKDLLSKFVHFCLRSQYRSKLSRLLDRELPPPEAAELRTHLTECARCQHEYEQLRYVKRAIVEVENPDAIPSYAEFQTRARAFELLPLETYSTRTIRSTPALQLKLASYALAVAALSVSCFLLGASYASVAEAIPAVPLGEQMSMPLHLHLLTAPAISPVKINAKNNDPSSPPPPPHTHTRDTAQLWEQIAQNQQINLQSLPEPKRGDPEQQRYDEPPLLIVMSKAHYTGIRLELPEDCEKGQYLLSVEKMDGKPLPITAEEKSPDGAELSVSLDLRGLTAGKYFLLVERKNEEQLEYIGHFPVRMVDPTSNAK
jgi:hypothetical protein